MGRIELEQASGNDVPDEVIDATFSIVDAAREWPFEIAVNGAAMALIFMANTAEMSDDDFEKLLHTLRENRKNNPQWTLRNDLEATQR